MEASPSNVEQFAHYLWNIALCESLYPALQCLEVTLRNSIHDSATTAFDNSEWYESVLVEREKVHIVRARTRLENQGKVPNSDDIVAALSLGFWVNLLYRSYEQILWPRLFVDVFPHLTPVYRTRRTVSRRLNPIRYLRNRVFHHEPVWHWKDLAEHHERTIQAIGWINPEMQTVVSAVDRFPEVYAHGLDKSRMDLLALPDVRD